MRNGALLLGLVVVFLTLGVPRRLAGDTGRASPQSAESELCREHGGTPRTAPGSRGEGQVCVVRYGLRVYHMVAIAADGFDEGTARYQRQGCEEARREQRDSTVSGRPRETFIYHPTTGVCERTP
jgi:hypothetical protein